VATDVVER